ncbi:MAG: peptidoglycan-binding domain-containing protein [Candidatus Taylorbacteria bacterium]
MKKMGITKILPYALAIVLASSLALVSNVFAFTNGEDDGGVANPPQSITVPDPDISNGQDDSSGGPNTGVPGTVVGDIRNGDDDSPFVPVPPDNPGDIDGEITNGDDDTSVATTPPGEDGNPEIIDNGVIRRGGGGGSRPSFSNGTPGTSINVGLPSAGSVGDCIHMDKYLRQGADNDPSEVRKLQMFLHDNQGFNVDVTGDFDDQTLAAVNAFQGTYLEEVMGPWGEVVPSGQVYISTVKKINELSCKIVLTFTAEDYAIFAAYKKAVAEGVAVPAETPASGSFFGGGESIPTAETIPSTIDTNGNGVTGEIGKINLEDNKASASSASVGFGTRIANFFRGIFNFFLGR